MLLQTASESLTKILSIERVKQAGSANETFFHKIVKKFVKNESHTLT